MKTDKKILIAFILNLTFSVFEIVGGIVTGSVAILSDAVHDVGDAVSIGLSFFLERKSRKEPDDTYTYGYRSYSLLGSFITYSVLALGSVFVCTNAVDRIVSPREIEYNAMIVFAVVGVGINLVATVVTHGAESLNQKAVYLHMLEDVLGWVVVLVGAIVMRLTDIAIIDPLMSIAVAVFIMFNAVKGLKEVFDIFMYKTPANADVQKIREHICNIDGVVNVHHLHLWSIDGEVMYATMHIVTDGNAVEVKKIVSNELAQHSVVHATLETETPEEKCDSEQCCVYPMHIHNHHHCHHGH